MPSRCVLLAALALLGACTQKPTEFDCSALVKLLAAQAEAISAAQQQLEHGRRVQEIQQGLGAVVAKGDLVADQCYESNLDAGHNCIKLGAFGRAQDLGGLLRALHGAELTEGPKDREFVRRMLSAAQDEASKPVSGPKCMGGT